MLGFMFSWLTFYHQGHEVNEDFKPYMRELQFRIQKVITLYFYLITLIILFYF